MSLSLGPRRIYPHSVPDDYRASPSIAGLPRCACLLSGFCSSGPSFASLPSGRPLPSDSASRRTPLLWLAVPVITARKGLAPSRYTTCLAQSGRRGPHGPRPPTPPYVLIVYGGSLYGCISACVSAGQGSFSVQRRGCLPLLKRSRSGSAFTARAGAHALPTGSTCLAVAPHPSSIPVCSLPQKVRPFISSR